MKSVSTLFKLEMIILNFKIWILAAVLFLIFLCEKLRPQIRENKFTWTHDRINMSIGILNYTVLTYAFLKSNLIYTDFLWKNKIGILNALNLNGVQRGIISFFVLDVSIYVWHVLLHKSDFLYRFHAVHHTDRSMNVTTAFRFHFGELVMGNFFRFLAIGVFGIAFREIILYEVFLNMNVYLHHSNFKISPKLDKLISRFVVSPYVHRIHHSVIFKESNSNFGSVFVFWDRLFGTYTDPRGSSVKKFGDPNFKGERYQKFSFILAQPFKSKRNFRKL
jgi:sterol desaturase/sphingolipid hydroxylase (fatty acid hydroxylase superfamily)